MEKGCSIIELVYIENCEIILTRPFLNFFQNIFLNYEMKDLGSNPSVVESVPSAKLDTDQHWPSIAKNLPKIGCQYRAVAGMITPVCTWRPMLAQTLAASTCFRHSNGPMLCRTLVFSLPGWFAVVKVTHGPVMCRP